MSTEDQLAIAVAEIAVELAKLNGHTEPMTELENAWKLVQEASIIVDKAISGEQFRLPFDKPKPKEPNQ